MAVFAKNSIVLCLLIIKARVIVAHFLYHKVVPVGCPHHIEVYERRAKAWFGRHVVSILIMISPEESVVVIIMIEFLHP